MPVVAFWHSRRVLDDWHVSLIMSAIKLIKRRFNPNAASNFDDELSASSLFFKLQCFNLDDLLSSLLSPYPLAEELINHFFSGVNLEIFPRLWNQNYLGRPLHVF